MRLYLLPVRRVVMDSLTSLAPLLLALLRGDRMAAQAFLCQTRGAEAPHPCGHCQDRTGVFEECVTLPTDFNNRCANCIFSGFRDCSWHRRYKVKPDDDYEPPSGFMSVGMGQQRTALMGQEQTGQDRRRLRTRRVQERMGQEQRGQEQRGQERRGQEQGEELRRQGRQRPGRPGPRPAPRQRQTRGTGTAMCPIDLTEEEDFK